MPFQVSVLRGKVMKRDGSALSGVAVSVLNHPEFGQTLSRVDGGYDLAVNGGEPLMLSSRGQAISVHSANSRRNDRSGSASKRLLLSRSIPPLRRSI